MFIQLCIDIEIKKALQRLHCMTLQNTQRFSFTSGLRTAVLSLGTSSSYPLLWKLSISCPVLPSLGHLYEHLGLLLQWENSHLLSPTSEGVHERWGEPLSSWYGGGCSSSSGGVLLILWMQLAVNKWKFFTYFLIIYCWKSSVETGKSKYLDRVFKNR